MLLVIGNKNYSSWSLRSWIALKMLGVPVDKKRIALRRPETKAEILRYSSAGRVPILRDGDTVVWGSLAILEYLAEKRPQLWPSDPAQRAKARSVAAVRRDPRERAACLTTLAECPLLADSRHIGKRPKADIRANRNSSVFYGLNVILTGALSASCAAISYAAFDCRSHCPLIVSLLPLVAFPQSSR